ncbi:MAG: hypothetical protein NW208_16910 [Bryobacter sp.]|nr:hypothetical protein [Bryobacter sp.]
MNVKPVSCLLALSLLALPIFSQQPQKALASVDRSASPISILKATIEDSLGKYGTAELVVSPAVPRKVDDVVLLVSYWRGDAPIGGHTARIAADSLYKTGVAKVSLSSHIHQANRVLFSVISATSGDRIWKKANQEQGPELLKAALNSLGGKLADEDWVPKADVK